MTEYAYKLVSLKLGGQPDWPALERALKRGWEPVPLNEMPDPAPNPLDMTPRQLESFKLCRMPKERHTGVLQTLEQLNRGLAGHWTPSLMLTFKMTRQWPPVGTVMQPRIVDEDGEEISPEVLLTDDMLAGAELAYGWLNERGLA